FPDSALSPPPLPTSPTRRSSDLHCAPGGRIELPVCRGDADLLEPLPKFPAGTVFIDPAEETPDRVEVLHFVDERGTGERDEERIGDLASDLFGEREDVLRSLRGEVLDEVRLVNNHSLEPEITHPPQVSVEDLVV